MEAVKLHTHLENVWQSLTSQISILVNLFNGVNGGVGVGVKPGVKMTKWASDVQPDTAGIF